MINNKSYVVYRHTAPNGKMYVGITSKPPSYRWDSGRGYITNQHFIRAINKYGWNNIKHDILLENLTAEEASLAEEIFIHYWDLTNPNNGYNHETGGIKNFTVSDETRRRLSIACSGEKNGMYGRKHTKESKQKMSESSKNKPNPMKGKRHTIEKSPMKRFQKQSGLYPIVATMAGESRQRKTAWLRTGCNAFEGINKMSKPMSFWTEQDVLEYIDIMGLEVAPVYGNLLYSNGKYYFDGCQRTGCIFCGFGCHLEHEPNRFQRLKETHPKLYDYCMGGGEYNEDGIWQPNNKGLGMKHVMDFINVKVE